MNPADLGPFHCLVNGTLVPSSIRATAINPATEAEIADYAVAGPQLVDRAVAAAGRAQEAWADTSLQERRSLLIRIAAEIEGDAGQLAHLLTLEQGKPLKEAATEVEYCAETIHYYAALHGDRDTELFPEDGGHYRRICTPLGVVAGIIPWNFPLLIAAMKLAPALLTGNAIILKPAPTTPLATLRLAALLKDMVPPGLVQVLGDSGDVGPLLTAHPGVRKIAFTGSTRTGRRVMESAAATLKRITLELGGNDAAIVLDDADIPATAAALFAAAFTNAGQICGAAKRIYVHERVFAAFCEELGAHVRKLVVGNGLLPEVTLGPVQNRLQHERATQLLVHAGRVGRIVASTERPAGPGFFVPPSLVTGLDDDHPLVAEEQFAPLLPVLSFRDADEAVRRANASPYGLTASVWSTDPARAEAVAARLDAALICINKHNESPAELGISMSKQSGTGWLLGDEGLHEYLQPHLILR